MTSHSREPIRGLELARACARHIDEKAGLDIVILDLRGLSQIADFFVVASATSLPHLRSVRDEVDEKIEEEHGIRPTYREGVPESQWLVLDYIDVLVHIFHQDRRRVYALEELWSDAPRIDWVTGETLARGREAADG